MLNGHEIRLKFLDYFAQQAHTIVASSGLVPHDDPTLLFANAGMNQFKNCFLGGEKRAYTRATTAQKCMRISGKHNDFENVGMTARHHTFFEMLGNFSFGDYFKKEAIKYAWEFLTAEMKLSKSRLWVTIYEEDQDAGKLWSDSTDVLPGRILKLGADDNFWAMGDTGPCGPCSEIHYFLGDDESKQSEGDFRRDDGTYLEIWNLVFMQFDRSADGSLTPLPRPSIDTGMGLERFASVLQGKRSNYDCDLLRPIISRTEELCGFKYDGTSYKVRNLKSDPEYARDVAMRVIADHSRSMTFLIADGVHPGADGRGYVLRRLIRRAIRHGRALNFKDPFLAQTCATVVKMFAQHYPNLTERLDTISRVVDAEERKFHETLDAGLSILTREAEKLSAKQLFPGHVAFQLHDTFGFPLDLTEDALKAYGRSVDHQAFDRAMQAQRTRSRDDRKAAAITFKSLKINAPATQFCGYADLQAHAKLLHLEVADDNTAKIGVGAQLGLVFDQTPFYAESGGQVGDHGMIESNGVRLQVNDTTKTAGGHFLHHCEVLQGELSPKMLGQKFNLTVDAQHRDNIRIHHSATHILHAGLRAILGKHVQQAGSRVDDNVLRFDFSHFEALNDDQIEQLHNFINDQVRANHEVQTEIMQLEQAKKRGAMALFGEKYSDTVRVVQIGDKSLELCGGTHVKRSGDIGFISVVSEGGVSAGVRRIECVAGNAALHSLLVEQRERRQLAQLLKGDAQHLPDKVERVLTKIRQLERENDTLRSQLAQAASSTFASNVRKSPQGISVIAEIVPDTEVEALKGLVDNLRVKLGSGVVALASTGAGGGVLVSGVTNDLVKRVHAGNLVKQAAATSGGRGGGRADFAQAGGLNPNQLRETLDKLFDLVE